MKTIGELTGGKVVFEVMGGDPVRNRRLEEMFGQEILKRLEPKKLWQCRCECGEILGSGYQRRISLARAVPHCEGAGMRWEPQPLKVEDK